MGKEKFNCYKCKHRGEVPGSAHIRCKHPSNEKALNDPMLAMLSIFASIGRVPPHSVGNKQLNIKGNAHGISKGWFNYPHNFDPCWLDNCDGFERNKTTYPL